jgi:hypothetical protein
MFREWKIRIKREKRLAVACGIFWQKNEVISITT